MDTFYLVLGLEVHLHLKTRTKMFCYCDADIYGAEPNTHTCPTCLGLPGALPVANFDAVKMTQKLGIALGCKLNVSSKFDRKHYFYPDLPKGYQISQYKEPLCGEGTLQLSSGTKVDIERIHLEEDTAKSFHQGAETMIDFNKSGMPLVEIVTAPCFETTEDAVDFCKQIQELVKTLGISDADMEKGQMRLEANISMRTEQMRTSNQLPDYKVEVKNINSFRFMEKAVKAEITRQTELLLAGQKVLQENRGFNEATGKTTSQREKEEAKDYRYFPEPDIPPMSFKQGDFDTLKNELPELPSQKLLRYKNDGLSEHEATFMSSYDNRAVASVFEDLVDKGADPIKLAKLLVNKPETWELTAEEILEKLAGPKDLISDDLELTKIAQEIITKNPAALADYKKGKTSSVEFLIGQIMAQTKGKADIPRIRELLHKML